MIIVKHVLGERPDVEFDGSGWVVEFGEGPDRLHVTEGPDGKIDVRALRYAINIEPRAAGSIGRLPVGAFSDSSI